MDKDARRIRAEIAETRLELGETVAALAYKSDVKARMNDALRSPAGVVGSAFALGMLAGLILPGGRSDRTPPLS